MYTASAEYYDLIYSQFKDYAAEVAQLTDLIRRINPAATSVLDVACGTGEHAKLLAATHGFQVDGVDLNAEFLRLARLKHPAGQFYEADMREFTLPGRYDAIICMFSSIGYVKTLPELQRTLRMFRRHLAPGGVVIVEPWFPPEAMKGGQQSVRSAEAGGVRVERVGNIEVDGRLTRLQFDYTIHEGDRVRQTTELHELGLFTVAETLDAFSAAGLNAEHHAPSERNRGLYIARASD